MVLWSMIAHRFSHLEIGIFKVFVFKSFESNAPWFKSSLVTLYVLCVLYVVFVWLCKAISYRYSLFEGVHVHRCSGC